MYAIRPWLYVGKFRETQDEQLLQRQGTGAMLQLAESVKSLTILSIYIPIADGEPLPFELLSRGIEFVRREKAQGHNLLIACGAGIIPSCFQS